MKSESFEFADVSKVKYEVVEEHMADKKCPQNKEDNSSGQENLSAMGFVHYITTDITWVIQFHDVRVPAIM